MADISAYIDAINRAIRGEEVRDAIIDALEIINNKNDDAYFLEGHRASDFVLKDKFEEVFPLAEVPTEGGTQGVSSGGLYTYIWTRIGGTLNAILGTDLTSDITTRLQKLVDIKKELKNAIKYRGTDPGDDEFSKYPDLIKNLSGVDVTVSTLNITSPQKKEYEAGEKKAYDKVNVDINFSSSLIEKTIAGASLTKGPTEDTVFDIKDEPAGSSGDKPIGYSKISVNISDKLKDEHPIDVDPNNTAMEYLVKASEFGMFGFSSVKIKILESPGPFTVKFYANEDKTTLLDEQSVPKNGVARYSGDDVNKYAQKGYRFKEWNPQPINVIRDMDCIAQYEKKSEDDGASVGERSESWSSIGKNGGADIPIGDWKVLHLKGGFGSGRFYIPNVPIDIIMQKVASGEGGNPSTWISRTTIGSMSFPMYDRVVSNDPGNADGYYSSDLKAFLNTALLKAIQDAVYEEEGYDSFGDNIKSVKKKYLMFKPGDEENYKVEVSFNEQVETLSIWLPSATELGHLGIDGGEIVNPFKAIGGKSVYSYVDDELKFPDLKNLPSYYRSFLANHTWTRTGVIDEFSRLMVNKVDSTHYTIYNNSHPGATIQKVSTDPGYRETKASFNDNEKLQTSINMASGALNTNNPSSWGYTNAYTYINKKIYNDAPGGLYQDLGINLGPWATSEAQTLTLPIIFGFCT